MQISAKKEGSTITTSIYADQNGDYVFPALADGKYNVWAQALGFATSKGAVDLTGKKQQDFKLAEITDPELKIKQMPIEMLAAALPGDTEADANMKRIFHNQCTGCHTPGYPLPVQLRRAGLEQDHQSDEAGRRHRRTPAPTPSRTASWSSTRKSSPPISHGRAGQAPPR